MTRDQGDTPRTPREESPRQQSPPGRPPQQGGRPPAGSSQGRQPPQRTQGQQSRQSPQQGGGGPSQSPGQQGQRGPPSQGVQSGHQPPQGSVPPSGVQHGGMQQGGMQQGGVQQPTQSGVQGSQRQSQQQSGQRIQRGPSGGVQSQQPGLSSPSMQHSQMGQGGRQTQLQSQIGGQQSGAGLLEPVTIDDVVTTDVYTVESDTRIQEIVEEMDELNVGSAIVEEDDTPIGVLTDRKIAMALADDPNVVERTADDLTGGEVVSAMTGTQISEVLDKMSDESIRRIPVVDENGELEGIVTLDDVMMLLESKMSKATDTIQGQLPDV